MEQYRSCNRMNNMRCPSGSPANDTHFSYNQFVPKDDVTIPFMPVGMCYVPMQEWGNMYQPCKALHEGTAFKDLNLIFCGKRGKN